MGIKLVIERKQHLFMSLNFSGKTMHQSAQTPVVTFTLVTGDVMQLKCDDSDDIKRLVCYMIDGLRKRSTFAVALENYEGTKSSDVYHFPARSVLLPHTPTPHTISASLLIRVYFHSRDSRGEHSDERRRFNPFGSRPWIEGPGSERVNERHK